MFLAVIAVIVAVVAAGFTYFSIVNLVTIVGRATDTGTTNLTVESSIAVNFTTAAINWSDGLVDVGQSNATLNTTGAGSVANGNWTSQTGLILENIGNLNLSLNISGGKSAVDFLGGTNPLYRWNFSVTEANACLNETGQDGTNGTGGGQGPLQSFYDVNTTIANRICDVFQFIDTADELRIDFLLQVPSDAPTGSKTDTITATVFTV